MLLACRALGLGASLTTIHHMFESELAEYLGVPDGVSLVALLPIGFPRERFGPVTRRPSQEITHFDRWDNSEPEPVGAVVNQEKENGS
jgi:nitroreductase